MNTNTAPLFIFEMANNHQGSLAHGLRIIAEMAKIARRYSLKAAVKLQYRDLDTFIHPAFVTRRDAKHLPRFLETRLSWDQFQALVLAIKEEGMTAVITPFDESSVEKCLDHGVDILKVASCSSTDWPLLETIAAADKPIICSTGGCRLSTIDKIVTFFEHRHVAELSLLHCVGIYPTQDKDQNLSFMRRMMRRYPHCPVGFSGHEDPDNHAPGRAAAALGAAILERHVGVPTDTITLNKYSMNPEQTARWVEAVLLTLEMCGPETDDKQVREEEIQSLLSLRRGVYAARPIKQGQEMTRSDVFFAMPCQEGQMSCSEWQTNIIAGQDYATNEPVMDSRPYDVVQVMRSVVHEAKGMLREAGIAIGGQYQIELSHHYGMDKFRRHGAVIIDFFNREYCKKLILLLPGQSHPSHTHRKKEETFQILWGEMELSLDGTVKRMQPGDFQLVRPGEYHSFGTKTGVIFEEISTTHIKGDSIYEDEIVRNLDPMQRKTVIEQW